MSRVYPVVLIVALLGPTTGCKQPTASAPAEHTRKTQGPFHGDWAAEGELAYHITQQGNDPVRIETPPNETWRVELKNIRLEGDSLRFEQYHYTAASPGLKSNTNPTGEHPFSGVKCDVTLTPDAKDDNLLHHSMTTVHTPQPITGKLRRQLKTR